MVAILIAIMTGVLISRVNIQYCVVAEMLAVSGATAGGGGTPGQLLQSVADSSTSVHGELLHREVILLCCCSRTH